MNSQLHREWDYQFHAWMRKDMTFDPAQLIASVDTSESYEKDAAHVFKNENGTFHLVSEKGCSCYTSDDACLTPFPSLQQLIQYLTNMVETEWQPTRELVYGPKSPFPELRRQLLHWSVKPPGPDPDARLKALIKTTTPA